jgi:hypothetical protein
VAEGEEAVKRQAPKVHELVLVRAKAKVFGMDMGVDAYQCTGCCRLLEKRDAGGRCDGVRTQAMFPAKKGAK